MNLKEILKNFIEDYLNYSKKEQRGILGLFIVLIILLIAPVLLELFSSPQSIDHTNFQKEIRAFDQGISQNKAAAIRIDINRADTAELIKLPGIGKVYAGRIIAYRKTLGGFTNVEQLKEIKGIGEKTFLKILPYLETINNEQDNPGYRIQDTGFKM